MRLNAEQLQNLINEIFNKIQLEIFHGNASDELDEVLKRYNLSSFVEEVIPTCEFYKNNPRSAKILILSAIVPPMDKWRLNAKKKFGIDGDRIEFQEVKQNFDFGRLRNTSAYSDIFVGPLPHKGVGIGDNTSFLAAATNHPEEFPRVHRMQDSNGTLIASQSAFERCLEKSNFVCDKLLLL